MVRSRKYVVTKYFEGLPKKDDFEIVEYELPPLQDQQILVNVEWISVDPHITAFNKGSKLPYDQFGHQIGVILESKNKEYPIGTRIISHHGWCDYCIMDPNIPIDETDLTTLDLGVYKLPDLQGLSPSLGLGAVGMSGLTAYFGFLEICNPKPGETVVVTTAAGAVGSIVGQIAKIKGCKVIGFTGSDDKVKWLENDLGFDHAFNYKTVDVTTALKEVASNGVDCYFDNVGGELSNHIMKQMNSYGRVSICGCISGYHEDPEETTQLTVLQPMYILMKQLKIEGFAVHRWIDRWPEAFVELTKWIKSGDLKIKEHITEGFDNIYDAFMSMISGNNFGKAVVKVS